MSKVKSGIYKITNLVNGKVYIGSTNDYLAQFREHRTELKRNVHFNTHLQSAYNKYGVQNFKFEVIEFIENLEDLPLTEFKHLLEEREEFYIQLYESTDREKGYNVRVKCDTSLGMKWSEESKKRFSEKKKGKPTSKAAMDALMEYSKSRLGIPNEYFKNWFDNLSEEEYSRYISKLNQNLEIGRKNKKVRKEQIGCALTEAGSISYKNKRGYKVAAYDECGNLCHVFLTIADALEYLGDSKKNTSCITNVLNKYLYKGYFWISIEVGLEEVPRRLESEFFHTLLENNKHKRIKRVAKYDENHSLIEIYKSSKDAATSVGLIRSDMIKKAIEDKKFYRNFYWEYYEPTIENSRKQGELLGTPEVDNQQPSLDSNIFEGSTTNDQIQTSKVEDGNIDTSALHDILDINDDIV